MPGRLLFDTDVFINDSKNDPRAIAYLEPLTEDLAISVMTLAELYSGVREGRERTELDLFVSLIKVIPVDREIALDAGSLRLQYRKSHRLSLPDTLIAATSRRLGIPLVTLNRKHYPMLSDLIIPYEKT